jgi:hypothetical protein
VSRIGRADFVVAMSVVVGVLVVSGTASASGVGTKQLQAHAIFNGPPTGYTIEVNDSLSAPPESQASGSVNCPAKTVAYGGGVEVGSLGLAVNVSGSVPKKRGRGWTGTISNDTTSSQDFGVAVVCAHKPTGYKVVVSHKVDDPTGTQASAAALCPGGSKVLGGGGSSSSSSTLVDLNSTFPVLISNQYAWRVYVNNLSGADQSATATVVCGKGKLLVGYVIQDGTPTANPPGQQTNALVACPGVTVPLGGGVLSSGFVDTGVNVTAPFDAPDTGWTSYEDNAGATSATVTPIAICAGT